MEQFDAFKNSLEVHPQFLGITRSSQSPLSVGHSTSDPTWDGKPVDTTYDTRIIKAGFDFVETMGVELLKGRGFSQGLDKVGGTKPSYIVNQQMAEIMQTDDPVGGQVRFWGKEGTIVGLVRDFHISSMYRPIAPLIIILSPLDTDTQRMYARIAVGKEGEAIKVLERLYDEFNPGYPFDYRFVDEDFDRMYRREGTLAKLAAYFAVLAGFISCIGLLGLASFTAVQRTKEIGIRKALGATVANLTGLLSRDFMRLVGIAILLAVPIAHFVLNGWLDEFAYRVDMGWILYVVAGGIAVMVSWLAVGSQAVKVAMSNPVNSLRSE